MATLTRHQIIEYFEKGDLIINPFRDENGNYDVEPASYDLRAGTIVWKELNPLTKEFHTKIKYYDPDIPLPRQQTETLQPGQVMFVITHEEIKMPVEICGTVYAKNSFSRDGILAFTTGHVDPGIQCPIVIRLINLRAIPFTIRLGQPVYTIVFNRLELDNIKHKTLSAHPPISMEKTLTNTMESANSALGNALNDLSLTKDFVRRDEFDELKALADKHMKAEDFGVVCWQWVRRNVIKTFLIVIATLVTISSIVSGLPVLFDYIKKLTN